MRISDCVIFLPGGSRQGQSRQCWGRGCLCYLRQLASGSQGTQNHLRRAEDNSETKTKWWWWGRIDEGNLNLNEFKVSLPGSDSSAKAMICSPSTSSSCGKNEDKLNSLVWTCYTRNSGTVPCHCFSSSYPDLIHVVWLQLPQGWSWKAQRNKIYFVVVVIEV